MSGRAALRLEGCRSQPLAHYLKALGVFRVVAEQLDAATRARWDRDTLVLEGEGISRALVEEFFLDAYRPAPIVSPWNKSSGFDEKPTPELALLLASDDPRLESYRHAIRVGLAVADAARRDALTKDDLVLRCRGRLPDDALPWLDAAVVLTDGGPAFPPILGTGGNLGRLELSRNYMAHVALLLGLSSGRKSPARNDVRRWLASALYDEGTPQLVKSSIAQYDPGPAGGANMAPDGKAESIVNPWDFVLVLEGGLLFASAAARRQGADSGGAASMPFTTAKTPAGYATSAVSEPARGEFWAPIWGRAMTLRELARLLAEGRAEWQGRQARSGLDFVRAVASLGTDRGVERFVRHAFVDRLGQMSLAVPVGVVQVRERPQVRLLGELDGWLARIRRGQNPPASVRHAVRAVENTLYQASTHEGPGWLQELLVSVADLHGAVERASSFRSAVRPLSDLVADRWLPQLDDGSDEFAVAASLASAKDPDGWGLRSLLSPVREDRRGFLTWSDRSAPVSGLGARPPQRVLAEALQRHAIERRRSERTPEREEQFDHVGRGIDLAFRFQRNCPGDAVLRVAQHRLDEQRLSDLLRALLLLNWRPRTDTPQYTARGTSSPAVVAPPAAAVVLPFFHGRGITLRGRRLLLRADPTWPRLLAVNSHEAVVREATARLRMAGLAPAMVNAERARGGIEGPWLAVAALCRLPETTQRNMLDRASPPEIEEIA